jgi:hypothetical protein
MNQIGNSRALFGGSKTSQKYWRWYWHLARPPHQFRECIKEKEDGKSNPKWTSII